MPSRTARRRRRAFVGGMGVGLLATVALVAALTIPDRGQSSAAESPVTVAAAGDLGGSVSEIKPVGDLMKAQTAGMNDRILLLGDLCYPDGTASCYSNVIDPVYGSVKSKTIAAPGNHDAHTANIAGFFGYYPTTIPHAFDLANGWTVITVNTEVSHGAGSSMEQGVRALANDAAARGRHIIAITHHPRYTGGSSHGDDTQLDAIVADLDSAKADLFLAGHNHIYERFQPMGAGGSLRAEGQGLRFFTVGTGGNGLYSCTSHSGRQFCDDSHHGALILKLYSDHFDWSFQATDGPGSHTFDAGSAPTRTGGVPPSTTSSSSSTSSSTSSSSSSTSSSTTSTTIPTGCVDDGHYLGPPIYRLVTVPCINAGTAWSTAPWTASWDTFHRSAAYLWRAPLVISNTVAVNFGDGYHVEAGAFWIDHAYAYYGHDDCIENDRHVPGTVTSFVCGGYVGYSDSGEFTDQGSGNTVTIADSRFMLWPVPSPYKGPSPGSGPWFKTDSNSASLVLDRDTFVAGQPPNHGDLGPPVHLKSCSGNWIWWTGPAGGFPATAKSAWLAKCPDTVFVGA